MEDCCNNPSASASSVSSGVAVYDTIVTTSASATASAKTYEEAYKIATDISQEVANSLANTTVNNMNQTIDVVNKNIIVPINEEIKVLDENVKVLDEEVKVLNEFKESAISTRNITLDGVVDSLQTFTSGIFLVNYAATLINQHKDEIIANGGDYNAVLRPIFDKKYVGSLEETLFSIESTIPNTTTFDYYNMFYTVNVIPEKNYLNNLSIEQIKQQYPADYPSSVVTLERLTKTLTKLVNENQGKDSYYYCIPYEISNTNKPKIAYWYFIKDVVDSTKWIVVFVSHNISKYIPINPIPDQYYNLVNRISNEINYLENFPINNIWEYKNPIYFTELYCLYSRLFPSWTNKLIIECYIPNSDIDVPGIYKSVLQQLYYNFFDLEIGQIAFVTYSIGTNYFISVCQIVEYEGKIAFTERQISINEYINTPFVINNDTVINGYLDVKDHFGTSVIKTDNVSNITSFNYKIGVNEEISKVKGLVDINNLSTLNIYDLMTDMTNPLLYSYQVTNDISSQLEYGTTTVTIPPDYVNDVCVFKTPLLNKIEEKDITFLYVPSPTAPFGTEQFKYLSFLRIQTIVNELNKLLPQYEAFIKSQFSPGEYTFSFFELLNDTNYWYLCSLRAVLRVNPADNTQYEVFFVFTNLDVNSYMVNKSYLKDFISFTDKSSAANRFLNFCILIAYEPSVYNGLLNGDSIGSINPLQPYFTDAIIENPYFYNRLGYPEFLCFSDLDTTSLLKANILLNEEYPYLNGNPSGLSFLPNTDVNLAVLNKSIVSDLNKQFGTVYQQTFYEYYYWNRGPKISFVNIMPFNNKMYSFGIGLSIRDTIDESIVAKGDNVITGNMSIIDSQTESYIFSVNTVKKSSFSIYNTGIGTQEPSCKLDIKDCGIADVININEQFSQKTNIINYNIQELIDAGNSGGETAMFNYITAGLIDPTTGLPVSQTINNYFFLTSLPSDLNVDYVKYIYQWYYPTWDGQTLGYLLQNDVTNRDAIKKAIDFFNVMLDDFMFFNISYIMDYYSWLWGIKGSDSYCFRLDNGNYYILSNGVNLQTKLTVETNSNIQNLLGYYKSFSLDLQRMNVQLNSIPSTDILNEEKSAIVRNIYTYRYPGVTTVKYDIDFITNTIFFSILDFDTLIPIYGPININDVADINLRNLVNNFVYKLNTYYYTNLSYLNKNNYGVLNFEGSFADYISIFYCINGDGKNSVSILSLETELNRIVEKSLQLRGDCKISGDLYLYDNNTNTNFLFSDTNNHFLGLNTLDVYSNYTNTYPTTTDNKVSKPVAYFKTDTFPNTILERNAEVISDIFDPTIGGTDYFYFGPFSTLSSRRESSNFDFNQMAEYGKLYTTTNPEGVINAFGDGKDNKYGYGSELTFEIKDKSGYVKEAGSTALVMEEFDTTTGNISSGFTVYSNYSNTTTDQIVEKNIMYVSNDSQLSVNSIQLSGATPTLYVDPVSGRLKFGDKFVSLSDV
jgi:hypothetical protein